MKKLIIAAAIVCAAALSQAAAISWSSDAVYDSTGTKVGKNASLYIYTLTEKQYSGTDTAWDLFGSDVQGGGKGATTTAKSQQMTSKFAASTSGTSADTTYYYAVITTTGTGNDMKYIADKVSITTGNDGNGSYSKIAAAATTAQGAKTAWHTVPEPTIAMLLLLGVAGLALRRRRA